MTVKGHSFKKHFPYPLDKMLRVKQPAPLPSESEEKLWVLEVTREVWHSSCFGQKYLISKVSGKVPFPHARRLKVHPTVTWQGDIGFENNLMPSERDRAKPKRLSLKNKKIWSTRLCIVQRLDSNVMLLKICEQGTDLIWNYMFRKLVSYSLTVWQWVMDLWWQIRQWGLKLVRQQWHWKVKNSVEPVKRCTKGALAISRWKSTRIMAGSAIIGRSRSREDTWVHI